MSIPGYALAALEGRSDLEEVHVTDVPALFPLPDAFLLKDSLLVIEAGGAVVTYAAISDMSRSVAWRRPDGEDVFLLEGPLGIHSPWAFGRDGGHWQFGRRLSFGGFGTTPPSGQPHKRGPDLRHAVLSEGTVHFPSLNDAKTWMGQFQSSRGPGTAFSSYFVVGDLLVYLSYTQNEKLTIYFYRMTVAGSPFAVEVEAPPGRLLRRRGPADRQEGDDF